MTGWLDRTELLLGRDAVAALADAHVAVFGLGGVGGHAAEALARCGVGALTIVDSDVVDVTNLNRQVVATLDAVGQPKVDVMAKRIAAINPNCQVTARRCFYLPETASQFDLACYDYVVDAVDTVTAKLLLAKEAQRCDTPIVSCMGTARKLDPTAFRVADIFQTSVCPLAKVMRKECRKRGIRHLKVVYSQEPPVTPQLGDSRPQADAAAAAHTAPERRCAPGSVSFVPPVAGMILAGEVVKDLLGNVRP